MKMTIFWDEYAVPAIEKKIFKFLELRGGIKNDSLFSDIDADLFNCYLK